ncbi:maltose operon protein MalM [Bibersteinia trehalosi]|uniref:maltose operon protein MalM n=1 Tax=Bibersteinia trehalosi TaxID=47735 RepID=UPI004045EE57
MKKRFITTLSLASLLFSYPSLAGHLAPTPHINSQELAKIQWQDVALTQEVKTNLVEKQQQSFTTAFAGIASPVAAYRIPANQGTLNIEIESSVLEKNLFVPNVIVLDSHFNIAATYSSADFTLLEERGLKGNRLSAELKLTPVANQDYIYLLVYTTKQDLDKSTTIPHPAKVYAKATGKQPPSIKDIEVKHSLSGEIYLNVNGLNDSKFIGLPTTIFNSHQPQTQIASAHNQRTTEVDKDTEHYFNQAVQKALKAKDINKALNLINEAEKLGLSTPRQIFLKNVNTN